MAIKQLKYTIPIDTNGHHLWPVVASAAERKSPNARYVLYQCVHSDFSHRRPTLVAIDTGRYQWWPVATKQLTYMIPIGTNGRRWPPMATMAAEGRFSKARDALYKCVRSDFSHRRPTLVAIDIDRYQWQPSHWTIWNRLVPMVWHQMSHMATSDHQCDQWWL